MTTASGFSNLRSSDAVSSYMLKQSAPSIHTPEPLGVTLTLVIAETLTITDSPLLATNSMYSGSSAINAFQVVILVVSEQSGKISRKLAWQAMLAEPTIDPTNT